FPRFYENDRVAICDIFSVTGPAKLISLEAVLLAGSVRFQVSIDRGQAILSPPQRKIMSTNSKTEKPLVFRFVDTEPILLELTNATEQTLKSIEILTIFLKDEETPGGGPSQAHIRFETIKSMLPKETVVLSHRTWINGRPADRESDQLERLKIVAGATSPYALDISW